MIKQLITFSLLILFASACSSDSSNSDDQQQDPCAVPTQFILTNTTTNSIGFEWQQQGASSYIVEYGETGFALGSGTQQTTTNTTIEIENLIPGTAYQFYVQARCSSTSSSDFNGPETFSTFDCDKVSSVNIFPGDITANSVFVDWSGTFAFEYEIEYGIAGFTPGTGMTRRTQSNQEQLTNLEEETTYDVYVRSVCGNFFSDYSDVVQFTTLAACPGPTSFKVADRGTTFITVAWSRSGFEEDFTVEYGLAGFTLGTGQTTTTPFDFEDIGGLTPNTAYDFYVRGNCGPDGSSEYLGPVTATTLP